MQQTRQRLAGMVPPPDGFTGESSRLRRHLMLEDKERLDAPTRAALGDRIGRIHLVNRRFRCIQEGNPPPNRAGSTLRRWHG
jgi:hypothetical protein